jgi:hypothetical protein
MPSTFQRHFAFKHPRFRSDRSGAGVWWENSVYYLWWEFLCRHEGYKDTCLNGGKGKYAKLYADFGNVHNVSFKDWWVKKDRGAMLFAEPLLPNSMSTIDLDQVESIKTAWQSRAIMVVVVPLTLRKRFILKRFNELLSKHHTRRRGQRTFRESRALYPIARQFNIHGLKTTLAAYDLRSSSKMTLWEIAQEVGFGKRLTKEELASNTNTPTTKNKKSKLSIAASKKIALADKIIDGVGRGVFPAIATREREGEKHV